MQMLLEQSRAFYFFWWNKSNVKEIKTTLCFACQININLKTINKLKYLGVPRIFPAGWATCWHTKKINLKLLAFFLDEIRSLKSKSCVIEKMPVTALRFAFLHSYNNYVKIVPTSTRQIKLKKMLIMQKHVIRIIFYVNEETRPRPSFQESILLIYVK